MPLVCESGNCGSDCLDLTEREAMVCEAVCESPEPVGFSAVRRRVGLHQEILSRILRRLVNYEAIERVDGKYREKAGQ